MKNTIPEIEAFKQDSDIRKLVVKYSGVKTWKQVSTLAFDWAVILGTAYYCSQNFSIPTYLLAVLIIATRQHGLLVIMHEASHYRVSKNTKLNDFISNYFAAWPVLLSTELYRQNHLAHHKYTNTEQDPDWVRKQHNEEWKYPQSTQKIAKVFAKQLLYASRDWLFLTYSISKGDKKKNLYLACLLAAVVASGLTIPFLTYWVVPMLTLFPVIQRIRSVSEHFAVGYDHELNSTRDVFAGPIETFLFSPHNVSFHLAHHLFPSVPQYNLKAFHAELCQHPIYMKYAHTNGGYLITKTSVLNDLRSPPRKYEALEAEQNKAS